MERFREKTTVSPDFILKLVCEYNEITPEVLFSNTRKRDLMYTRQKFFYLCYRFTNFHLKRIGHISLIYGRNTPYNHATVFHGYKKISDHCEIYKDLKEEIDFYIKEIKYKTTEISKVVVQDFNLLDNLKRYNNTDSYINEVVVQDFNLLDNLKVA
ncbi:DnaA protein [Cellulophaga phage phi18:3]|uniref:DnaA protein n=1 Tax=Cellulophaga phage phi18:3 TaxID=1327983 RepID=R9ZYT8_9CAUD|nr:DnaA protein [Cellulophaga phage phi18:3]AGO48524.1 DnaA protein [Cellulophaga phage phi18:3]